MTANQITKKLAKAGIDTTNLTIERDEVIVCVGYCETNNNGHIFGACNQTKTRKLARKVAQTLGWKNGFNTAYGAQVVIPNPSGIDFNNCL